MMPRLGIPAVLGFLFGSVSSAFGFTLVQSFGEGHKSHYTVDTFSIDISSPVHIDSSNPVVDLIFSDVSFERPDWNFEKMGDLNGSFVIDKLITLDYGTFFPDYRTLGSQIKARAVGGMFDFVDILVYEATTETTFGFPVAFSGLSPDGLPATDSYYPFFRKNNPRNGSTAMGAYDILWNSNDGITVDKTITPTATCDYYLFFGKTEVDSILGLTTFRIYDGIHYGVQINANTTPVPEPATLLSLVVGLGFVAVRRRRSHRSQIG